MKRFSFKFANGVHRDAMASLLNGKFGQEIGIQSWEGKSDGVLYKAVELTLKKPATDDTCTMIGAKFRALGGKEDPR
jgi:hypothetical protein